MSVKKKALKIEEVKEMPGFDGTGPRGQGPMTGGGRGFCALPAESYSAPAREIPGAYGVGQASYYGRVAPTGPGYLSASQFYNRPRLGLASGRGVGQGMFSGRGRGRGNRRF